MEILSVKQWTIPINDTMCFDCYEYKISFKGKIYNLETNRGDSTWKVLDNNQKFYQPLPGFYTPLHLKLETAFVIAKKKYLRLKKLERINENIGN